jgi:hypothetical protein
MTLRAVKIRVTYEFRERATNIGVLDVQTYPVDISPYTRVSKADRNGRADGVGTFDRKFSIGESVELTAAEMYGDWVFDRWTLTGSLAAR